MNLKKLIKDSRIHSRMTQKQLAQSLQISLRTLQNWEQGRYMPRGLAMVSLIKSLK